MRRLIATALGLAAVAGGAALVARIDEPQPAMVVDAIGSRLGAWTIAAAAALAFLETGALVGLVAPGEVAVIVAGAVAGRGAVDLAALLPAVWIAAAAGDSASFWLGRRHGRRLLVRYGPRLRVTPERLRRVERHFAAAGMRTILLGRFIGVVRAVAPLVAGSSGMPYGRFVVASLAGTAAWASVFVLLGFGFARSLERADDVASVIGLAAVTAAGAWAVRAVWRRHRRRRAALASDHRK